MITNRYIASIILTLLLAPPASGEAGVLRVKDLSQAVTNPVWLTFGDGILALSDLDRGRVLVMTTAGEAIRAVDVEMSSGAPGQPLEVADSGKDWVVFYPMARSLVLFDRNWKTVRQRKLDSFYPFGSLAATPAAFFFSGSIRTAGGNYDMNAVLSRADRDTLKVRVLWPAGSDTDRTRLAWSEQEGVIARSADGHIFAMTQAVPDVREFAPDGRLVRIFESFVPEERRLSVDSTFANKATDRELSHRWYQGAEVAQGLAAFPRKVVAITERQSGGRVVWIFHRLSRQTGKRVGRVEQVLGEGRDRTQAVFAGDRRDRLWAVIREPAAAGQESDTVTLLRIVLGAPPARPESRAAPGPGVAVPIAVMRADGAGPVPQARLLCVPAGEAASLGHEEPPDEDGFAVPSTGTQVWTMAEGRHLCRAWATGYRAQSRWVELPTPDGPARPVAFALERAAAIRLRVRDAAGRPAMDGEVDLLPVLEPAGRIPAPREAMLDAEGRVVIADLAVTSRFRLLIRVAGSAPRVLSDVQPSGAEVEIDLDAGLRVEGRVIDPDERPIEGVRVTVHQRPPGFEKVAIVSHGQTDRDGQFSVGGLLPAPAVWRFEKTGRATAGRETDLGDGNPSPLEVSLEAGRSIKGRVTMASAPVEEATVQARGAASGTTTDPAGLFQLDGLPAGSVTLDVSSNQSRPRAVTVPDPLDHDLLVELEPGGELAGIAMDAWGAPVPGVVVAVRDDAGRTTFGEGDGAGVFQSSGLAPGRVNVTIEANGFVAVQRTVMLTTGTTRDLGEIVLQHGLSLEGWVVAEVDGAPLAGVQVEVSRADRPDANVERLFAPPRQARTDPEGRFVLAGLTEGIYDLLATRAGAAPLSRRGLVVGEGAVEPLELVMGKGETVFGQVEDCAHLPVAGLRLSLRGPGFLALAQMATSDAAGEFQFDGVADGPMILSAAAGGAPPVRRELMLPADAARPIRISVCGTTLDGEIVVGGHAAALGNLFLYSGASAPPGMVDPLFLTSGGNGLPEQTRIVGDIPLPPLEVPVDAAGRFHADSVAAGSYQARYVDLDGAAFEKSLMVPDVEQAEMVLSFDGVTVSGRVVDESGPISRIAAVYLQGAGLRRETVTTSGGAFDFSGVPPGAYSITAQGAEGQRGKAKLEVAAGSSEEPVRIVLVAPGGHWRLTVFSPDGRGVPGALVLLRLGAEGGSTRILQTGPDGTTEAEWLPPGAAQPCAVGPGLGLTCLATLALHADEPAESEIRLSRAGVVHGVLSPPSLSGDEEIRIRDSTGLEVSTLLQFLGRGVISSAAGEFRVADLSPGAYTVEVRRAGQEVDRLVQVEAGHTTEAKLIFPR